MDEVPYTEYTRIVQQINQLANGLDVAKILVTCRSGDFTQTLKGFKILQLNGLTNSQIKEISDNWLENSDRFMEQLEKVPYKDMASSPLLLTQVICIYKFEDELPAEPRLIYRNLLTLLLKEWDRGRGFNRKSKYALFDSDSKLDFLSALSYELTYQIKTITFSESLLIDCYKNICDRHRLPKEEAIEVVREIESHTGIIIVSGKFSFQFSHLSLQEYLCAYYIVREPRAKQIPNYIKEYPAPLAITIALSSNPSIWFADLILKYGEPKYFSQRAIQIFISRLLIEQPRFSTVSALGYAILHLFKNYYEAADNALKEKLDLLLNFPFIVDSLRFAVGQYWILRPLSEEGDVFHLVRQNLGKDKEPGKEYGYPKPGKGLLPKQTLLKIVRNNSVDMYWCDEWGGIGSKFRSTGDDYEYL